MKQSSFIKRWLPALQIGFLIAAGLVFFSLSPAYEQLELKALDLRFFLAAKPTASPSIVHIDIDDTSITQIGRWPWPRTDHAALIKGLSLCGAKSIGFDVLFIDPNQPILNIAKIDSLGTTPEVPSNVLKELLLDPDQELKTALENSKRVYLPLFLGTHTISYSPILGDLLHENFHVPFEEAIKILKVDEKTLRKKITDAQIDLLEKLVEQNLNQDPHLSFGKLVDQIQSELKVELSPSELDLLQQKMKSFLDHEAFAARFGIPAFENQHLLYPESLTFTPPIDMFQDVIQGSGFVNMEPDQDGVMRRIPLFWRYHHTLFFQHFFKVACDEMGVKPEDLSVTSGRILEIKNAKIPGNSQAQTLRIPLDEKGNMILSWAGLWEHSFTHLPAHAFVQLGRSEKLNPALQKQLTLWVKDKICIVGLTATATHDMKPAPLESTSPGVSVHSNLINTIFQNHFIHRVSRTSNIVIFFVLAFVLSFPFAYLRPSSGAIVTAIFVASLILVSTWFFQHFGTWMDLTGPILIGVFEFAGITSYRYFTEEREKLWIRHAFKHYVSQNVVDEILEDPKKLMLGGERKKLTVLFADIRGFTTFSERNDPETVVKYLNEYMEAMTQVIFDHSGTLDKFVGDEIMAIFGAPSARESELHAEQAVKCALAMNAKLSELQKEWKESGRQVLEAGIGINSGDMVVGNMGSKSRMDYTVIGDNVNLAARLCGQASGHQILVTRSTFEAVSSWAQGRALEAIPVKGKTQPVEIFEITGLK